MDPLSLIRLRSLMNISGGSPDITIGLIDGPVDLNHPAFNGSTIRAVKDSQLAECKNAGSIACSHGTFIAGILCAKRGLSAPAICPSCTLLLRPIFTEQRRIMKNSNKNNNTNKSDTYLFPSSNPEDLSDAIIEIVNAGARIINLSLGLSTSSLVTYPELQEAYDYARQHGTIIIAASGNQGNIGSISLLHNQWIIPVAACDEYGHLDPMSNFGPSVGGRGLMAPGINVTSTSSGGGYVKMSGTSFAAPFVTGVLALLWSVFPTASPAQLVRSIRVGSSHHLHRSIMPPLLNVETVYHLLESITKKQ
jgi:subtilisin family serine protease